MRNGWDIFSAIAIRKLIKRLRPEIVQTYMGRATRLTRVPKEHCAIHIARLGGYYKVRGYYEHADAWVGNTRGLCDYLVKNGLPADRVYHIGNFVEKRQAPPKQEMSKLRNSIGIPDEATIIFSLGRFNYKKGFEDLLQAFKIVKSKCKNNPVYLIIAGDGELKHTLHSLGQELGLYPNLLWLGWQKDPTIFYALADIFVCPSRIETMGNVILEAWSHSLPVVATKTPAALELIEPGVNGLLVPIQDPEALANELMALLKEPPNTKKALGAKGKETLDREHSKETVVKKYLTMYEELINHKGRYH